MGNQKSATYLDSRQSAAPQHFVIMIAPNGNNNNNNNYNIHINNRNNNCNTWTSIVDLCRMRKKNLNKFVLSKRSSSVMCIVY